MSIKNKKLGAIIVLGILLALTYDQDIIPKGFTNLTIIIGIGLIGYILMR
jgi:hypothetical protein